MRFAKPSENTLDSIVILRRYCAGKIDVPATWYALRQLEESYGWSVRSAVMLFRRAMSIPDQTVQKELLFEALNHLIDRVFRRPLKASLWQEILKVWRPLKYRLLTFASVVPAASSSVWSASSG